ncbi:hypothetical protein GCM10010149_89440 [Nonomuraea roseoviolacea subsp. roseoviolacea]|uniref:hypothetical protein n=1 Tax=Nonomuraea roseoviolacea TaxID=103837 RepID=UPI0031E445F5
MADGTSYSPFSPHPGYPEKAKPVWERKFHDTGVPGRKGPLRFEEGIATDRDIPSGFTTGIMQGYETAPSRPNHNKKVDTKYPAETLAERAHVGSSSWVEAPLMLGEFSHGVNSDHGVIQYEVTHRDGGHYNRANYARVMG